MAFIGSFDAGFEHVMPLFYYFCIGIAYFWHPIWGICISDLGEKRFLFQFFHEVDVQRVLARTPWFFNNHLLLLHRIQPGDDLYS